MSNIVNLEFDPDEVLQVDRHLVSSWDTYKPSGTVVAAKDARMDKNGTITYTELLPAPRTRIVEIDVKISDLFEAIFRQGSPEGEQSVMYQHTFTPMQRRPDMPEINALRMTVSGDDNVVMSFNLTATRRQYLNFLDDLFRQGADIGELIAHWKAYNRLSPGAIRHFRRRRERGWKV